MKTRESGVRPDIEPTFTMLAPVPSIRALSTKYAPKTWQARKTAFVLTAKIRSISSSGISRKGVAELVPAPFTRTSTRPARERTLPRSVVRPAREVASHGANQPRPPASAIRARRRAAFSPLRPTRTTSAPAEASPSAIAPQSSPVPPTTTATFPESPNGSSIPAPFRSPARSSGTARAGLPEYKW